MNYMFADDSWLVWIFPTAFGLTLFLFALSKFSQKQYLKSFNLNALVRLTQSVSRVNRRFNWAFQILVLCLILVALARPLGGEGSKDITSEGIEIIFAVDVSTSMLAEDVRPSRLEQAKTDLAKIVDLLPGHKVGLVAFAGSAAVMSPLTNDPNALKLYLDSLSTNAVSTQGTDFTEALTVSEEAFDKGGVTVDNTTSVSRVILIASDGEDQEEGALAKVKELTQKGIRVFTVAYGSEKGGPIPERDSLGYNKGFKQDRSGTTIISKVDGKALKALASAAEGSFYYAVAGGESVKKIVEDINLIEKSKFDSKSVIQYSEKFQIPLLMAFMFLCLAWWFSERKQNSKQNAAEWKGRI